MLAAVLITFGVLTTLGVTTATAADSGTSQTGLTRAQAGYVQQKINQMTAADASVRQVSQNTVERDGVRVAIGAPGQTDVRSATADYECRYERLCTWHNGTYNEWWTCQRVWLSNWGGAGWVVNNQTPGTVSTFYNQNGSKNFSLTAGQYANLNWDPIWSFQVC
jgi:hypothetical protein